MNLHPTSSTPWRATPIAAVLVGSLVFATPGVAFDLFGGKSGKKTEQSTSDPEVFWEEVEKPVFIRPKGVPNTIADLAEHVSPAVVNIQISVSRSDRSRAPSQWREFHDFPFEFGPHGFGGPSSGEGSGFVISSDGYIVTNTHVIDGADEINVGFLDGRKMLARVVGFDEKTDIALIKVESEQPLQSIPLGDSDRVRPGEWVVAIGNAMSLAHSVTAGIVSAKHRYLARGNYDDFIQTDAAINPGNSGGPLINLAGEVIGINTAINPQANTIGFAVPIKIAKQILPQLKQDGRVSRSWLGVEIHELTEERREQSGAKKGALVHRVLPATPAMLAGIEAGDVIIAFDGTPVKSHRQLPVIVANTPNDRAIEVEVMRSGERRSLQVTLALMEEPEANLRASRRSDGSNGTEEIPRESALDRFGLDVQDLDRELAEQLGLEDDEGVIVTGVAPGSPAEFAGLLRGDVILEVEGDGVETRRALDEQLEIAGPGAVLLVRRDRTTLFVPLDASR